MYLYTRPLTIVLVGDVSMLCVGRLRLGRAVVEVEVGVE